MRAKPLKIKGILLRATPGRDLKPDLKIDLTRLLMISRLYASNRGGAGYRRLVAKTKLSRDKLWEVARSGVGGHRVDSQLKSAAKTDEQNFPRARLSG